MENNFCVAAHNGYHVPYWIYVYNNNNNNKTINFVTFNYFTFLNTLYIIQYLLSIVYFIT